MWVYVCGKWRIFITYQPGCEIWNLLQNLKSKNSWAIFASPTSELRSIRHFGVIFQIIMWIEISQF